MSTIVLRGGFHIWPELIEFLTSNLAHEDKTIVENSIRAVSIIVEDCSSLFEQEEYCQVIYNMLPNIFRLLDVNQSELVKENAINTVNILLLTQSSAIVGYMEQYAHHLLTMQYDPSQ